MNIRDNFYKALLIELKTLKSLTASIHWGRLEEAARLEAIDSQSDFYDIYGTLFKGYTPDARHVIIKSGADQFALTNPLKTGQATPIQCICWHNGYYNKKLQSEINYTYMAWWAMEVLDYLRGNDDDEHFLHVTNQMFDAIEKRSK